MMRSLWTGATGMVAQQLNIDVISNNLANVNTTGFKKSRAEFEDLMYQTMRMAGATTEGDNRLPVGIQVGMGTRPTAVAQQDFFISVRNTSEPVVIINGSIPTTKPEPQLHGFGLANIRLILEKYSGEYTMFYENGWFQFTADIPFTPIS